jgi:hypothetical protein
MELGGTGLHGALLCGDFPCCPGPLQVSPVACWIVAQKGPVAAVLLACCCCACVLMRVSCWNQRLPFCGVWPNIPFPCAAGLPSDHWPLKMAPRALLNSFPCPEKNPRIKEPSYRVSVSSSNVMTPRPEHIYMSDCENRYRG